MDHILCIATVTGFSASSPRASREWGHFDACVQKVYSLIRDSLFSTVDQVRPAARFPSRGSLCVVALSVFVSWPGDACGPREQTWQRRDTGARAGPWTGLRLRRALPRSSRLSETERLWRLGSGAGRAGTRGTEIHMGLNGPRCRGDAPHPRNLVN